MSIFHAYDIRGKYPRELNEKTTEHIAYTFVLFLNAKNIVIGRDARISSPALWNAVVRGLRRAGAHVTDIGLCTTPQLYFASAYYHFDGAIMITASHLPPDYDGLKLCGKNAEALSSATGLKTIEQMLTRPPVVQKNGSYTKKTIHLDYMRFCLKKRKKTSLRAVVDCGNMMGSLDLPILKKVCAVHPLFVPIDGTMPNRQPDPLIPANIRAAQKYVRAKKADLGIIFDADADRVVFLDEQGTPIAPDLVTGLLGLHLTSPSDRILFDVRSSHYLQEKLRQMKRKTIIGKVGHSLMMHTMLKSKAVFGGEKSGHYFFRDFFSADNALLAALTMLEILDTKQQALSTLVSAIHEGYQTPELDYSVTDKQQTLKKIEQKWGKKAQTVSHLDGVTIIYPTFWFNIRQSNTQDLLRVTIEAREKKQLQTLQKKLAAFFV